MPRLKVFRAHLGFYDTIVAATSQKKALAAWGADASEFSKGFAAETKNPAAVRVALASPGVALKRPYGSGGDFKSDAELPKAPKLSSAQKKKAAEAERRRRTKAATEAKAAKARARAQADCAKVELAEISREEKALQRRKSALEKKLRRP